MFPWNFFSILSAFLVTEGGAGGEDVLTGTFLQNILGIVTVCKSYEVFVLDELFILILQQKRESICFSLFSDRA